MLINKLKYRKYPKIEKLKILNLYRPPNDQCSFTNSFRFNEKHNGKL